MKCSLQGAGMNGWLLERRADVEPVAQQAHAVAYIITCCESAKCLVYVGALGCDEFYLRRTNRPADVWPPPQRTAIEMTDRQQQPLGATTAATILTFQVWSQIVPGFGRSLRVL